MVMLAALTASKLLTVSSTSSAPGASSSLHVSPGSRSRASIIRSPEPDERLTCPGVQTLKLSSNTCVDAAVSCTTPGCKSTHSRPTSCTTYTPTTSALASPASDAFLGSGAAARIHAVNAASSSGSGYARP